MVPLLLTVVTAVGLCRPAILLEPYASHQLSCEIRVLGSYGNTVEGHTQGRLPISV
jgi:hypothetical protein